MARKRRQRGSGSIVTKNGRLYMVYPVGKRWNAKKGKTETKQKWEALPKGATKKDATKILKQRIGEVSAGKVLPQSRTFNDLADEYLMNRCGHLKQHVRRQYEDMLRLRIRDRLGGLKVSEIRPMHLYGFQQTLLTDLSVSTAKLYIRFTKQLIRIAMEDEDEWGISRNPIPLRMQWPRDPRPRVYEPYTPEEAAAYLKHVPTKPSIRCPILVALFTGMRVGEILAMTWENVDWEGGKYHITHNLTRDLRIDTAKTEGSESAVILHPLVIESLRGQKERQQFMKRRDGFKDAGLIFATATGKPYPHHQLGRRWHWSIAKAAGLRHVSFHTLRKTFGSLLLHVSGGNMKEVQDALRHADATLTANTYTTTYDERLREDLDKIATLLAS